MFLARLTWHRLLSGFKLSSRKDLADRSYRLHKQIREGEIMLGYHCWEDIGEEDGFDEPYWQLREALLNSEIKNQELASADSELNSLDKQLESTVIPLNHDEKEPDSPGPLPPRRDGKATEFTSPETDHFLALPKPELSFSTNNFDPAGDEYRLERQRAEELQRRFKTLQTKLRVMRRAGNPDPELATLRTQLQDLRNQFETTRIRLKQFRDHLPAKERDSRPSGKVKTAPEPSSKEQSKSAGPKQAKQAKPNSSTKSQSPQASLTDDLRRRRNEMRTQRERIRSQLSLMERERDEFLRRIGNQLRRGDHLNERIRSIQRENRQLLRRLEQLAEEARKLDRVHDALR